jgi:hypothetical protein
MAALTMGGLGVAAMTVAPVAAHASGSEWYTDVNDTLGCGFYPCGHTETMLASSGYIAVGEDISTTFNVSFNGHWCLSDGNGYYVGVDANGALYDTYSTSCNLGGDEWEIVCNTSMAPHYEFNLKNVHTGDYVYPTSGGVYHAIAATGGQIFLDNSDTECA